MSMIDNPLLSICIPTYNRAEYLKRCLEAIVQQDGFDDRVEVVISDNCSSDNTKEVGEDYQKKYNNVHYYRNEKNLADGNFPLTFQRARGALLKLTNDTILYKPGAIRYMLKAAEENLSERPQLFFLNSDDYLADDSRRIDNLEEYIGSLGYLLTWIGSIAIWKEDCNDLDIFEKNTSSHLGQVPFLIEHFEKHNGAVVYCCSIMKSIPVWRKDISYGLYAVFYKTFLGFITPYVKCGKITNKCFEKVRKKLLMDFFCVWIVAWIINRDRYIFSKEENLKRLVEREYLKESYYIRYWIKMRYYLLRALGSKILGKIWNKKTL